MTTLRRATAADATAVVALARELFAEVGHEAAGDLDAIAGGLIGDPSFLAILAFDGDAPIGLITVSETAAVYAGGTFGCIHEFYVRPQYRSAGLGAALLRELQRIGAARGWQRLEVTAAPRAVEFYRRRNGFEETGPRLKLHLT